MRRYLDFVDDSPDPTFDLISLEELKTELGITVDTTDELLMARITRWSLAIAEFLNRTLALRNAVETFVFETGECLKTSQPLLLWMYPVVAIDSVTVNDSEVTDYELDKSAGRIWRSGGWSGTVVVTYSGGYSLPDDAPAVLQWAVIEAMRQSQSFATRDPTIRQVSHGDTSVGFYSTPMVESSSGLPTSVAGAIAVFRRPAMA
jgi:hypothetical protein